MKTLSFYQLSTGIIALVLLAHSFTYGQINLQPGSYFAKELNSQRGLQYDNTNEANSAVFSGNKLKLKGELGATKMMFNLDFNVLQALNGIIFTDNNSTTAFGTSYGIAGIGTSNRRNIPGFFSAQVDTLGSSAVFAGGDVTITGSLYFPSDRKLKENIRTLSTSLPELLKLNPASYSYKFSQHKTGKSNPLPQGEQTGFIAQELAKVFPHLVTTKYRAATNATNPMDQQEAFVAINYVGLIPILVKGIQEQQTMIEQQALDIQTMAARLDDLEEKLIGKNTPAAKSRFFVKQNYPNPFDTRTTIQYFVPETAIEAKLIVFGNDGRILKEAWLNIGQEDSIELSLNRYPSAIYYYTVEVDGKILESKKMIRK